MSLHHLWNFIDLGRSVGNAFILRAKLINFHDLTHHVNFAGLLNVSSWRHESAILLHPLLLIVLLEILLIFIKIANFVDHLLVKLIFGCYNGHILKDLFFERFGQLPVQFLESRIIKW